MLYSLRPTASDVAEQLGPSLGSNCALQCALMLAAPAIIVTLMDPSDGSSSPVHQIQQYYRLGVLDNCYGKWNALLDCLSLKMKRTYVVEETLETPEKNKLHVWDF